MLSYHAGMIEKSIGNKASARSYLEQALASNAAYFHPTQPAAIRAMLRTISG